MVHRNFLQTNTYCQASSKDTQVISIVGLGGNNFPTFLELPRDHDLVRDLKRLMSTSTPSFQQEDQIQHELPSLSQYIAANLRCETSSDSNPDATCLPQANRCATRKRRRCRGNGGSGSNKRGRIMDCDSISANHGLCRGHGGGRRCQCVECTKSAQSRSKLCWAHGGGHRCEVKNCMRSCKSKHFCVYHANYEEAAQSLLPATGLRCLMPQNVVKVPKVCTPIATSGNSCLPSMMQALRSISL